MTSRLIVLDTNVLISAALKQHSHPADILKKILTREISTLVCPGIVAEYKEVFSRPKFKKWNFPPLWFDYFLSQAIWIERDPPNWPLQGPDEDDLLFLSFAYQHGATLITGNLKDYPPRIRRGTSIVEPSEYAVWLKQSET